MDEDDELLYRLMNEEDPYYMGPPPDAPQEYEMVSNA